MFLQTLGYVPQGCEYSEPDKIMIGIAYQNEVASNFYTYLFKELKDFVNPPVFQKPPILKSTITGVKNVF
jgi:hypothetical protein